VRVDLRAIYDSLSRPALWLLLARGGIAQKLMGNSRRVSDVTFTHLLFEVKECNVLQSFISVYNNVAKYQGFTCSSICKLHCVSKSSPFLFLWLLGQIL